MIVSSDSKRFDPDGSTIRGMHVSLSGSAAESGMQVMDLQGDVEFAQRRLRARHVSTPIDGVNRLARALVEAPETILQELVQAAIDLCGADSAGISMEYNHGTDAEVNEWAAMAGDYSKLLQVMLPRAPVACELCLQRGRPQHLRISREFFARIGLPTSEITDGILLPWQVQGQRGTLWILAHGRTEAFDQDDCRIMRILTDLAAMGVRQQGAAPAPLTEEASQAATTRLLAKKFDHSLQGMRSALYVAGWSPTTVDAKAVVNEMTDHLDELSGLVRRLFHLPEANPRPN